VVPTRPMASPVFVPARLLASPVFVPARLLASPFFVPASLLASPAVPVAETGDWEAQIRRTGPLDGCHPGLVGPGRGGTGRKVGLVM
jgi:hypothetical protein